jgi:hypothetical protein
MKPADTTETPEPTVSGKHLDVPAENDLTYNCDALVYSNAEMMDNSGKVCVAMDAYISDFLAARNYRGGKAAMMDRVRQYADRRMNDMMGDRYAVQRMLPYSDYITAHCEPWMRYSYASKVRGIVQSELMNLDLLNQMLDQLVGDLGMQQGEKEYTAAEVQQVRAQEREAVVKKKPAVEEEPVVAPAYTTKESKQGFDVIAGFYINKATANKMASRLHAQGCDAYIIEKNDGYYVSMGSAPTRTKAEALFNHLKSWYDGDIAIKQW